MKCSWEIIFTQGCLIIAQGSFTECLGALTIFHVLRLLSLLFPLSCFLRQALLPLKQHFLCKSRGVWGSGSTKYEVNETKLPNWQDRWRSRSRHSHAQAAVCSWLNKSYAEAAWVSGKYNCPKERAPLSPCFMTHLLLFLSKGKLRSKAFKSICFNNPHHQSLF